MRLLRAEDEAALRTFWLARTHAHLFAEADLDEWGWDSHKLEYWGWFDGEHLVGYLMRYGISVQWYFTDPRVVPQMAARIDSYPDVIEFSSGIEVTSWPVLNRMRFHRVVRHERGHVAVLHAARFRATTLHGSLGRGRAATLDDLDALTELHMAAPDQWSLISRRERYLILRRSLLESRRRLFLAENADGQPVAAAQTIAEGTRLAVVGAVVTHPDWRNQGYGTVATAHLCASLLQSGHVPYLFYRRTNRAAASLYGKIGFQVVDDWLIAEVDS